MLAEPLPTTTTLEPICLTVSTMAARDAVIGQQLTPKPSSRRNRRNGRGFKVKRSKFARLCSTPHPCGWSEKTSLCLGGAIKGCCHASLTWPARGGLGSAPFPRSVSA